MGTRVTAVELYNSEFCSDQYPGNIYVPLASAAGISWKGACKTNACLIFRTWQGRTASSEMEGVVGGVGG